MINKTICITEFNNKIISWLDSDSKMLQLAVTDYHNDIVGNIYNGKVKHIVKNLNACFIEYMDDKLGFLSFNDVEDNIMLKEGSEIPVQIVKEASKNKEAVVTSKLSLAGKYCVVEAGKPQINISRKISGDKRASLRNAISDNVRCSIIIRTNASELESFEIINDEINQLCDKLDLIISTASTRTSKSLLYSAEPEYLRFIKSIKTSDYQRILTDNQTVFDTLSEYYDVEKYNDQYPLSKLYSLETKLEEVLGRQVWLKSGGNIVIDVTEAMTVIDVNSAKNLSKKSRDENALNINKEAASEIARQLRLRNISGIIIIDFINMDDDSNLKLIEYLKNVISEDNIRCDFIEMTKLGLVEIVRRKIKPPIYEILHK